MQAEEKWEKPDSWTGERHRYVLYCTRLDCDATLVWWFHTRAEARKFLDELLASDEIEWRSPTMSGVDEEIVSSSGVVVSCRHHLGETRAVFNHEPTLKDMARSLDSHVRRLALQHRHPKVDLTDEEVAQEAMSRRERRASSPTAHVPAGYVHVSDIALALGIEPRQARGALRDLGEKKPAFGWHFSPDDVEAVKTKIKGKLT